MPIIPRVCLILVVIFLASTVVFAQQDAERIVINYPEVAEGGEDQLLRLYFTVLNGQGMAVPDAEVESATVVLDNGTRIEIDNPTRPNTPLYIVLVLDASGSMQQAAPAMRQAATEAINIAPQEALFAIIQFNQQVNLIQGFTADRTLAANMVNTVNSVPNSGTCLYDATYSALELMGSLEPTARRAVIVFTDGRDEITLGRGDKCSTHSYDEVIDLATDPNRPIPIHTIGLRGDRNINEQELRNTASATGGLSAIGGQDSLNDLFRQIMDALRSQWLVEAPICIESGTHSATLSVKVGSTSLEPDAAQFEIKTDCSRPTPTAVIPTPTPRPLILFIESFRFDSLTEEISFEIRRQGDGAITQYRVQIKNAETNLLMDEFFVPAVDGQITAVAHAVEGLSDGEIVLRVDALDASNIILNQEVHEDEFVVARPTATPTATLLPTRLELTSVRYDAEADVILLSLDLNQPEAITDFEVSIINQKTNLLVGTYQLELAENIEIIPQNLTPGEQYIVRLTARGSGGERLTSDSTFTYTKPTPEITPTPQVKAEVQSINLEGSEFVIDVLPENETQIKGYTLRIVNKDTGLLVTERTSFDVPPYDKIRLPSNLLTSGEYTITLIALDANNVQIATSSIDVVYDAPTPTPMPTATPSPGPIEEVTDAARDNPVIVLAILLITLILIALFVWLVRSRQGRTDESWGPLPESGKTMVDMKIARSVSEDNEVTEIMTRPPAIDARIIIIQTPDPNFRREWEMNTTPYKIGRQNADLTLAHDKGISRHHATIFFEAGQFFITDEQSGNGTFVDGQPLTPKVRVPLSNGAEITLGQNTKLRFEVDEDDNATQIFDIHKR